MPNHLELIWGVQKRYGLEVKEAYIGAGGIAWRRSRNWYMSTLNPDRSFNSTHIDDIRLFLEGSQSTFTYYTLGE